MFFYDDYSHLFFSAKIMETSIVANPEKVIPTHTSSLASFTILYKRGFFLLNFERADFIQQDLGLLSKVWLFIYWEDTAIHLR